jgi:hypothetical protein
VLLELTTLSNESFVYLLCLCVFPDTAKEICARGLRLELAFLHPSFGNTLGGCASNWHSFAPALATRRGLHLELAFLRPSIGNTLGVCALNWHSFAPVLVTRSGAAPYNPMLATLGGYAYMLTLASTFFVPGVSNMLGDSTLCC